jgi:protocatechuate 3,4-dioxygenase beta subunit
MSKVMVGGRRRRRLGAVSVVLALAAPAFAQRERAQMPARLSWQATLVPAGEPGDALIVSGTVFAADGRTPAPGVVVYAYQTDARGLYTPDGQPGVPRLHGWMRTDERGRYEFRTIRPASYPGQTVAAHIHMSVNAGGREQSIDDIHFEGDPLLTSSMRQRMDVDGPFATLCLAERDGSGERRCTRNIRLAP